MGEGLRHERQIPIKPIWLPPQQLMSFLPKYCPFAFPSSQCIHLNSNLNLGTLKLIMVHDCDSIIWLSIVRDRVARLEWIMFVCLCVCLVRGHAWVLMGPDLNKRLKSGYKSLYKHAGWVGFENKVEETNLKSRDKWKEDHSHSQQNKFNNFTVSLWDTRKEVLHPISIATEAMCITSCMFYLNKDNGTYMWYLNNDNGINQFKGTVSHMKNCQITFKKKKNKFQLQQVPFFPQKIAWFWQKNNFLFHGQWALFLSIGSFSLNFRTKFCVYLSIKAIETHKTTLVPI